VTDGITANPEVNAGDKSLPNVPTVDELHRLLDAARTPPHRAVLWTVTRWACGSSASPLHCVVRPSHAAARQDRKSLPNWIKKARGLGVREKGSATQTVAFATRINALGCAKESPRGTMTISRSLTRSISPPLIQKIFL
jgi:hypothetical protein